MRRRSVLALAAAALVAATLLTPADSATTRPPAIKLKAAGFGNILATRGQKALYYWNVEKRDFKVRCTGKCAKDWPPLVVRSRVAVPKRVTGIRGTFGGPTAASRSPTTGCRSTRTHTRARIRCSATT